MDINFDQLKTETYDLQLPSLRFSELSVERTVTPGFIYQDSLQIESTIEFFAHVEVTGAFLHVENKTIKGKEIALGYRIDGKRVLEGQTYEGRVVLTYLGGESIIPFKVKGATKRPVSESGEAQIEPSLNHWPTSEPKAYSLQLSKKAYSLDEVAVITLMNHQPYPITVKVLEKDPSLDLKDEVVTVQDRHLMHMSLQQTWVERYITRKYSKRPETIMNVTLEIRYENGKDIVQVPVTYSTLQVSETQEHINTDKDFRRSILKAQSYYNKYLVKGDRKKLDRARVLVESAMDYHRSLVDLRLFHLLLLLELDRKEEVSNQVNEMIQYSSYYLEDRFEAFIEILSVIGQWLEGENVDLIVGQWPMTPYRQIFRLRIFETHKHRFSAYETMYNQGFRSSHFFALVVASLNEKPMVPSGPSALYRTVLQWAITKNGLGDKWLEAIGQQHFQMTHNGHVSARGARRLYELDASDGLLTILADRVIEEEDYSSADHAVCLEILRRQINLTGLERYYVICSARQKLPIDYELLNLFALLRQLDQLKKPYVTYFIYRYLEDERTDKSPHSTTMRYLKDNLATWLDGPVDQSILKIMVWDINEKLSKCRWDLIRDLYKNVDLNKLLDKEADTLSRLVAEGGPSIGYEWFHHRLTPEQMLILSGDPEGYSQWMVDADHRQELIDLLGKGKIKPDKSMIQYIVEDFQGSLDQLLKVYDMAKEEGLTNVSFEEQILYKGLLTRQVPDRILSVYLSYRRRRPNQGIKNHVNRYFAARILLEAPYGYEALIEVFEEDLHLSTKEVNPIALALLRLYQAYGANSLIVGNLVKNAVNNGIILPWFADSARPFIKSGSFRKAAFFSYNSQPGLEVVLHYRSHEQNRFRRLRLKHVCYGLYTGYIVAFYGDRIQYYIEEGEDLTSGRALITESGVYSHDVTSTPLDWPNDYDAVNTVIMAREMADMASEEAAVMNHLRTRAFISNDFEVR